MKLRLIFILVCSVPLIFGCQPSCGDDEIQIFHGQYFKKGQKFKLLLDDGELKIDKEFYFKFSSDEYTLLKCYKPKGDSVKVYFILDAKDTTFYLNAASTSRLVIGSDAYGNIIAGSDKDESFWVGPD